MSFDRKIDQVCEHYVRGEALFLAADRMTIRPLRPISVVASVSVRANSEALVPIVGHQIPASATGFVREPFTIVAGSNDQLVVNINHGPDQVITAQAGSGITAKSLSEDLTSKVSGGRFLVTKKRQVRLETRQKGKAARIFVQSGSTLATTLGLPTNRAWLGRQPYPGWTIINDPNTLLDRPTRLIIFDEPLKGTQDFVEIDYTTIRQECRRCGGLGVENDWRYTKSGNVIEVRDEALLIQEALKMIFTIQGSNPFHSWYGTGILNVVGKKQGVDTGLLQSIVVADIQEGFRRWRTIKKQQEEVVGQVLTDEEFPFRLLNTSLEQSQQDPTIVFVNVTVQSRSEKPIQLTRGVRIPEPTDLLGATAQQGVFRRSLSEFVQTG